MSGANKGPGGGANAPGPEGLSTLELYQGQPLPHDRDAELSLIGSILVGPGVLPDVRAVVQPRDLFDDDLREVFRVMVELADEGQVVNEVTICTRLMALNVPESTRLALVEAGQAVPIEHRWADFAKTVATRSKQRRRLLSLHDEARVVLDSGFADRDPAGWHEAMETRRAAAEVNTLAAPASPPAVDAWPEPPDERALHGPAGEFVRIVGPHTEADPMALLVQFLVGVGNLFGRSAHFTVEASKHFTNLFTILVGRTAKGRKGTSWDYVFNILQAVDPIWAKDCIADGLSTGEGLIHSVRDPRHESQPVKESGRIVDYEQVMVDPGVTDKRLLVTETEFGGTLARAGRENNTLTAVLRRAWDTGGLRTLTKTARDRATDAHISLIGHVTAEELRQRLAGGTSETDGTLNRFLIVCTKRARLLPEGGNLDAPALNPVIRAVREAVEVAKDIGELKRDGPARRIWHAVYPVLGAEKPGLFGKVVNRAEAQVLRLSMLFALLDRSHLIRAEHLNAALAVWGYCEQSAAYIFGRSLGNRLADRILDELREKTGGLTRTELHQLCGGHATKAELGVALAVLVEAGLVESRRVATGGRSAERFAVRTCEESEESEERVA